MRKLQFGSIEVLGYLGLMIWISVIFVRGQGVIENGILKLLIGFLPNLGAAWAVTMFSKWFFLLFLKKSYSPKLHLCVCISVLLLAFLSEVIHDVFFSSPFDYFDMVIAVVAQTIMFFVPTWTKERCFNIVSK